MATEDSAPCRHPGAPSEVIVDRVANVIATLATDPKVLASKGLTVQEYEHAFQAAIEKLRGSHSASNADRRSFLTSLFEELRTRQCIVSLGMPRYGDDTVYRLGVPGIGDVAIIQKGCPDGQHSSVRWSRPEWAAEAYVWWLCSSMNFEPGTHVWKGVNRLRQRFFSDAVDVIDGVIFHNELCGSPSRPCPKSNLAILVDGRSVPPPCIYVMPQRVEGGSEWNWNGSREVRFPRALLKAFGVAVEQSTAYTGYAGFHRRGAEIRTMVSSHFGPARSTSHRS